MIKSFLRPTSTKRLIFFIFFDTLLSFATLYLAYPLRFNFHIPEAFLHSFWLVYIILAGLKVSLLFLFKNYFIVWRFFSFVDAKNIIQAHIVAYTLFVLIYLLFSEAFAPFPRSVIMIDFFLSLIFIGTFRVSKRFFSERNQAAALKPTLLLGVNSNTSTIIQSAMRGDIEYYPSAIVMLEKDDNVNHAYIQNVKVYSEDMLETIIRKKEIVSVVVTQHIEAKVLKELVDRFNRLGIVDIKKVKRLGNNDEKLEDEEDVVFFTSIGKTVDNSKMQDLYQEPKKDKNTTVIK